MTSIFIPDDVVGGSAEQHAQAGVDAQHFMMLLAGIAQTGIESGCKVSAQASPNMTVAVAAGVVYVAGTRVGISNVAATASMTADGTNPRWYLVCANLNRSVSLTAGTANAVPVFPTIPTGAMVLAAVYVGAAVSSIGNTDITDVRIQCNYNDLVTAPVTAALYLAANYR